MKTSQQVAAAASASLTPRFIGFLAVCSALLGLGPPALAADTQFIIPSDRVDEAVYGAAANYDTYAQQRPEDLAYLKYIIELYRRRPNAEPQLVIGRINEARARFQETYRRGDPSPPGQPGTGVPRYDWFNGAINIVSSIPFAEYTFIPLALTSAREARTLSETAYHRRMEPIYRLSSLLDQGVRAETERLDNRNAFAEAFRMAQSNPRFAAAAQGALNRPFLNARDTLAANPDWASTPTGQAIQSLMNQQGEIVASIEQLKVMFGTELQNLQDSMNSNLALVTDLAARQDVLYRYMLNAEEQRLNQERIARDQAAYEQKVKAANASVYILSTLVGFNNPELGHQMQVVGDSTVQIADALHNFAKADALGSVILTGNMLGAVMNVVSLFSDSGPSPDQQILEGIRQLQQMVQQLRVEMHERFDRVDAGLNQIYTTMNDRFDRIDITLGILHGDVQEIQESLYNLQSDLYRIEGKMFAFLDAGFRRDLNETINGYLGYYETYGQPIPWLSYVFAENKFHTWSVNNALDEISSGSAGRGYDDASVYAELGAPSAPPLENNLNYLSQYLTIKGWPAFTTVRLANPRDWAIAANSWMELGGESPMFFRQVSSNRLEQIYRVGLDLQRAVTNITLVQANPLPVANRALFNALFANYRAKAATFKQRVADTEAEYRLGLSADAAKREPLRAMNPWGGADQQTSYRPSITSIPPRPSGLTHGVTTSLEMPANWQQLVPPTAYLAELVGVGTMVIQWDDYDFINPITGPPPYYFLMKQFQISLKGDLAGNPVFDRILTNAHTALWADCCGAATGNNQCTTWPAILPWFWAVAQPPSPCSGGGVHLKDVFVERATAQNPASVDSGNRQLREMLESRLRELQRGSYTAVLNGLAQAGSLQGAGAELSGAKALLDSLVVLGFSESLEGNDFIHSLLSGGERVLDTDAVRDLCQLGITRSYDTNQNAKVDIAAILDERINALETWVSNRLTQVQTNGRAESLRLVSSTLSRLDAFRAGWSQPTPAPYLAPLALRITNGIPNRLFIVWGEPNLRYTVQFSTNLTQWADLPVPANEGADYITTPTSSSAFYRAVLRP